MLSDLRNNIKLYGDVLASDSVNRCRLEHIIYPPGVDDWDSNEALRDYTFPCNVCLLKVNEGVCAMSICNLKVR